MSRMQLAFRKEWRHFSQERFRLETPNGGIWTSLENGRSSPDLTLRVIFLRVWPQSQCPREKRAIYRSRDIGDTLIMRANLLFPRSFGQRFPSRRASRPYSSGMRVLDDPTESASTKKAVPLRVLRQKGDRRCRLQAVP